MRRVFFGLAVAALTVLSLAGPASAASGQVTHFRFHGGFAEATWTSSTATSSGTISTDTSITAANGGLFVEQFTSNLDASGNFTGGTDTLANVTSGFSFTIPQSLAGASVSGSGLSARVCTFDADFNQTGCSDTAIDVNATWTGQGLIARGVSNGHFKNGGFSVSQHTSGTSRAATAIGTVIGITYSVADLAFADLGFTKEGSTTVCIGGSC
jgi:hypothetical protein